jgi:hypothetical protein
MTTEPKDPNEPTGRSETVSEMMETGANIVGRGIAAGIEGLSQLAELAMKAGRAATPSPATVNRATTRAAQTSTFVGRSIAKGARQAAGTTSRAATRVKRAAAGTKARKKKTSRKKAGASARKASPATARQGRAKTPTKARSTRKRKR